jgi:hypothetical protein
VQGIFSDRIQTIVRSRNGRTFDEIAETALEEESAIFSKNERYKSSTSLGKVVCHNCGKAGHVAAKCYLKERKDIRINKLGAESRESVGKTRGPGKRDIKCFNCGEMGHMARECRKPRTAKVFNQPSGTGTEGRSPDRSKPSTGAVHVIGSDHKGAHECRKPRTAKVFNQPSGTGTESRSPDRSKPSIGAVHVIGSDHKGATECIRLHMDISNGCELALLVDTGADISLIKPDNLDKTKKFDPGGRVKVKGVDGSVIETFGTVQTVVSVDSLQIPFVFQLVSKQIDIPCDEILGRDFLEHAGAQICYGTGTVTLGKGDRRIRKGLSPIRMESEPKGIRRLVLPSRTELVVRLPVKGGTTISEGITEKREIQEGIYLAGAVTKVQGGYAITSIANTTSGEVEIDEPVLELTETEPGTGEPFQEGNGGDIPPNRTQEVLQRLRLEHLNKEERTGDENMRGLSGHISLARGTPD